MQFKQVTRFIVLSSFVLLAGCGAPKETTVATIGTDKISQQEFEAMFAKNNSGVESQKASAEEKEKFLDLYIKFKLKVKEAYAHGYMNDPELRNELNDYRKNLAVSYMVEKEITGPALQEMYKRRQVELRASHILISIPENP